jgi:Protein of unknown function (DUF3592)
MNSMLVMFGVLVLVGAAGVFWLRRHSAALQAASVSWPTVSGVVDRSWIQTNFNKDGNTTYSPCVRYSFNAGGKEHHSHRIAWGGQAQKAIITEAQQVVARYPTGSPVKVYYNPKKSGQSVLEPNEKGGLTVLTILWITLVIVGVGIIAVGIFLS